MKKGNYPPAKKESKAFSQDYVPVKKADSGKKKEVDPKEFEEFQSMNIRMKDQPLNKKAGQKRKTRT